MRNKIYIVLPVFNRLKYTKTCLSSIQKQTYKNFELILVNDGSTDGTFEYVSKKYPATKIIQGDGSWWWTRSMYEGVKYALKRAKPGDYVLELNNDLIFEKRYFKELIQFAAKHPKSLVGSICVTAQNPKKVVEAGIRIDWPTGVVYGVAPTISQDLQYFQNMSFIDKLDALPGKGTLVPIEVFVKAGNFDYKNFPHYIADYEFSARAKRKGYKLLVDTKAVARHFWKATGFSIKSSTKKLSFIQAFDFLLGRKSMNNIVDWFRFVETSCPPKYRLVNYYYTVVRIAKGILLIKQFWFVKPILRFMAIIYHSLNYPKLAFYRLYLKIKQFPEYHLK